MNEAWNTGRPGQPLGTEAMAGTTYASSPAPRPDRARPGTADASPDVVTDIADDVVVDIRQRRADVVRRLLCSGVSHRTLTALLPEWSDLIVGLSHEQS